MIADNCFVLCLLITFNSIFSCNASQALLFIHCWMRSLLQYFCTNCLLSFYFSLIYDDLISFVSCECQTCKTFRNQHDTVCDFKFTRLFLVLSKCKRDDVFLPLMILLCLFCSKSQSFCFIFFFFAQVSAVAFVTCDHQ